GVVWFSESLDSRNHVVEEPSAIPRHRARMVTLDSLRLPARASTVIKVDVEGHGGAVLEGARALLARAVAPVWIVEVLAGLDEELTLVGLLRGLGYVPCSYEPERRALREDGRSRWSENLIFVRADGRAAVRRRLTGS